MDDNNSNCPIDVATMPGARVHLLIGTLGDYSLNKLAERRVPGVLDHNSYFFNVPLPYSYNIY